WGFKSLLACHLHCSNGMSAQAETPASSMDTVKLVMAVAILVAGIGGFYYFGETSLLLRVVALLAVAGVAVAVALQSSQGRALWRFAGEANVERRKVVWPSRQETIQTTLIVLAVVLLMGIFLWLVDMLLLNVVKALTGQGG
ncbi:MAG: preprotein translocase subunit SecE, partial [Pseudomonadota bacterium]